MDYTGQTDGYIGNWQGTDPVTPDFALLSARVAEREAHQINDSQDQPIKGRE
jgi:hypothetical protein